MRICKNLFLILLLFNSVPLQAKDFFANESYEKSKTALFTEVYKTNRKSFYCELEFDKDNTVKIPDWFDASKISSRVEKIEIEHLIPAEEFGGYIKQWWYGDKNCIDKNNVEYKGRKCAEKTSRIFRLMQSDLYNLYPAVGSINALRGNFDFTEFPSNVPSIFNNCLFKIADAHVEPADHAKGVIARTYFYFENQYPFFKIDEKQKKLFLKWNIKFPVTEWECLRTYRIEKIQSNENKITKTQCIDKGLWPNMKKGKKHD